MTRTTRPHWGRPRFTLARINAFVILLLLSLLAVYPFIWMVLKSLRARNTIFDGPFVPEEFIFTAYPQPWQQTQFGTHLLNRVLIALSTLAGIVLLSTVAGYAIAKLEFPYKRVIYVLLLSTMAMPATSLIIPLYLQAKGIGLLELPSGG